MLLKPGPLVSEMSGKIGGVVFARNRTGMYARKWSNPVQPDTDRQEAIRTIMGQAVMIWRNAAMDDYRAGWDEYAANVTMKNRMGEDVFLTGMQHFVRQYMVAAQAQWLGATLPLKLAGPTIFDLGETDNTLEATVGVAAGLSLAYDDTLEWNADGGGIVVWMGRPRNATVNFFKGPWRACGYVDGDTAVPASSPLVVTTANLPYEIAEDQRVSFAVRIVEPDGRTSTRIIAEDIIGA
jgi:hypothetical protein